MLHSGHAADGRVKRVSTQLSHLAEQNVGRNYLSGNYDNGNKQKKHMKTHQRETTKSFEIFILLAELIFILESFYLLLPMVYALWGFCRKTRLKELEKNHVLAAKSI